MVGQYIPGLVTVGLTLAAYRLLGLNSYFQNRNTVLQDKYDYIIVGAGTSGCVLADRLSENPDISILVVEAGGFPAGDHAIDIPIRADKARGSKFDWQYHTVPQKQACKSHVNSESVWPSGKGVGGSSLINYMLYLRGSRHDYDEWAQNGAAGWAYKDVLPYFIKSEDNHNPDFVRTVFHGSGGRMTVSDMELSPVTKIMNHAFGELGVKRRDVNGRSQYGYGHTQATVRGGLRWGTDKAFMQRALVRDNVFLLKDTSVLKVMFEGKRAMGVLLKKDGKNRLIKAKKEVILSAGTVGSAKLLLLSGVGPRNHLQSLKIPVIADLPVGDNLQDHVMSDGIEFFSPHYMSITPARAENFGSSWAYTLYGGGMKQSPRFREGIAYVRTRYQPQHVKYPLIALHVVANPSAYEPYQLNIKQEAWGALHGKSASRDGFTIFPVLLHPRSRGSLRLKSSNPEDPPLINPNYLAEDSDVKILIEAVQYARRLINTKVMQDWDIYLNENLLPDCAEYGNFTDQYIECYIRHITLTNYAPVGTCKMGANGDPTSVVDPTLKVRGLKGLRVVDASIIPNSMSGNTYATQVMIAEKAADMVKDIDSVTAIKEYFKHLIAVRHEKFKEDEDQPHTHSVVNEASRPH